MSTTDAGQADKILVARSLQGDRQAFGELVDRYRIGVIGVIYRLAADQQEAEEVAQEAFLRAWQRLRTYKPEFSFRNWIFSIATHIALDRIRAEKETVDIEQVEIRSAEAMPESQAEASQLAHRVQQAVQNLPPACRAVLVLREYEGLSYQEIASVLEIPVGTVMSRLNYARSLLRKDLAPDLETL